MFRSDIQEDLIVYYLNGKIFRKEWLEHVKLPTKEEIFVGIDQSTSCTGVCIFSSDMVFMAEYPRTITPLYIYKKALITELTHLLEGHNTTHIIYEKHNSKIAERNSIIHEITQELSRFGKLNMLGREYVSKGILPPVWRKGFFKDTVVFENRREELKLACVNKCIELYPELERYLEYSHKDFDGYEAMGIIKGYLEMNYKNGMRVVNTSMEYKSNRKYTYILEKIPLSKLSEKVNDFIQKYSKDAVVLGNKDLMKETALNRLMGEFRTCLLVFDELHPEFCSYVLEYGEPLETNETFIITVKRR